MTGFNEITILKAWGVFIVMGTVGGFVVGAIAGGVTGAIVVIVTGSKDAIPLYAGIAGFIVGLPVSYLCFRFAVQKFLAGNASVVG